MINTSIHQKNLQLGYLFLRLAAGVNLFGHGFIRLAGNYEGFRSWLLKTMEPSMIPTFLLKASAYAIPPVELILGVLLIIGFRTREALMGSCVLMISLIFGSCLIQNWDMAGGQMLYIVIFSALLAFNSENIYSVDTYTSKG